MATQAAQTLTERDYLIMTLRRVQAQPISKASALGIANSACAYLITVEQHTQLERRALAGLMRAGSSYEACGVADKHRPNYRARLVEALANAEQVFL